MKIYLASFLETNNFGPGRVISIADGARPDHIECNSVFEPLIPSPEISQQYKKMQLEDPKNAGKIFVKEFTKQLDSFYDDVISASEKEGKDPKDLLPFENEDTLASWQRESYTHYRGLVGSYLEKLGYDVVYH